MARQLPFLQHTKRNHGCAYFCYVTVANHWRNAMIFIVTTVILIQLSLFHTQATTSWSYKVDIMRRHSEEITFVHGIGNDPVIENKSSLSESPNLSISDQNHNLKPKAKKSDDAQKDVPIKNGVDQNQNLKPKAKKSDDAQKDVPIIKNGVDQNQNLKPKAKKLDDAQKDVPIKNGVDQKQNLKPKAKKSDDTQKDVPIKNGVDQNQNLKPKAKKSDDAQKDVPIIKNGVDQNQNLKPKAKKSDDDAQKDVPIIKNGVDQNQNLKPKAKKSDDTQKVVPIKNGVDQNQNLKPKAKKSDDAQKEVPIKNGVDFIRKYQTMASRYRHRFNCSAIIHGSNTEIQKVRDFLKADRPKDGYPLMDLEDARHMFHDCAAYKKIRGFELQEGSPDEQDFPLAYVILAHQDFDHLERLFRLLYRPQHVFCIHLDTKASDALKVAVQSLVSCFPNALLASEPQNVFYASISRLLADYVCMKDLVKQKRPWKYLVNMAATSVPLQTNMEIVSHMKRLKGRNDITMRYQGRIPVRWEREYGLDKRGIIWQTGRAMPPPPHNITVIKGMAYNTYSHAFLKWVINDKRAVDLLDWSRKTYSPDEHYWATLNNLYHNPELKAPGGFTAHPDTYRDSTFVAKFARNGNRCKGREIHRVCLFVSGELNYLKEKNWYLTSNKFDLRYDPIAYTCMEEWLHNRTVAVQKNPAIVF